MITNFFIPELNNRDVQELWFQQDGATCHTARATIDLLKDTFGDRLISRLRPENWAPRSCDLTPLDYFLWGYVKSLVYADKPQTLDHLEEHIRRPCYCRYTATNVGKGLRKLDAQIGLHLSQPWVTIDPAENHDTAAHIMTDPPTCLTSGWRQSQPYACEGVLQTCTRPLVGKSITIRFNTLWFLSLRFSFGPLFCFAELVLPFGVHDAMTRHHTSRNVKELGCFGHICFS
ncbi:putative transposable element [Trichonephila clavipes]|nr:putative transposable element [Trichonephila clavipes]